MRPSTPLSFLIALLIVSSLPHDSESQSSKSKKPVPTVQTKEDMAPPESEQNGSNGTTKSEFKRLPTDIVPKNYQITVDPDLVNFTFTGSVAVSVNVTKETSKIVLNALDMKILSAQYTVTGEPKATPAKSMDLIEKDELLIITMPNALKAGTTGLLEVSFIGNLNDKMKGFYRAKYAGSGGAPDTYAAVTQFESTDARRMFPCWDEPAVKATFDVTVIAPKNLTTLSNMPVVNETDVGSDKKKVKFAVTPIMSTYLLAVVVGDYDYVEGKTEDGSVLVRIYAPPSKKEQGRFALGVATKAITFYSDYFNIPYPLPKMDMIAISDFAAGAMENWGLVTYRETAILVDPNNTAAGVRQYAALVVAHELAHQWFGNLVTMEWWTHLWLNEGFATFMEYLCVDAQLPEFDIWEQFVTSSLMSALSLDALHTSHPIEVPVGHPSEIDEIFDQISYEKGSSVIRMLYRYLGDDDFRKGMSLYLSRHAYQNTQTEDLWAALGEASGKPVREIMSSWTKQKGFPLLSVRTAPQELDNRTIYYNQSKFAADGKVSDAEKDLTWMIPVTIITQSSPDEAVVSTVVSDASGTIEVPAIATSDWLKVNQESVGVYRVQYSDAMLQDLLPAIENKDLKPVDRLTLVTDLLALVQAGKNPSNSILELLGAYKEEDQYSVWSGIASALGQIGLIVESDYLELYNTWGQRLLMPIFSKIGWQPKPDEKHTDALLRSLVLGRLAAFDEPSVIKEAKRLLEAQVKGVQVIPVDIRSAVYLAVARNASDSEFESFFKLYRDTEQHEEKSRVLRSLGAVKQRSQMDRVLAFAISDEVRSQDSITGIAGLSNSRAGREVAWSFLKDNSKLLIDRYAGSLLISRLAKSVTEDFATEEKAAEVESYFASNPWPGTERGVEQAVESIRLNAAWRSRDSEAIRAFLQNAIDR